MSFIPQSHCSEVWDGKEHYLVRRTALSNNDVSSDATNSDTVWIQKLSVVFPTCTKVKLEDSVAVKHLPIITQSFI